MIDWVIVLAQIANFLILVLVLKYFFYGRVIAAMDEREEKIAERWNEAETERDKAVARQQEYEAKTEELDNQREQWIKATKQEVDEFRSRLMQQGREEVDSMKGRWQESLASQKEGFLRDLRKQLGDETCNLARRAVQDLADAELEECVVRVFLAKLRNNAPDSDSRLLVKHDHETAGPLVVRSAFPLSVSLQNDVREAVIKKLQRDTTIEFQTAPELICGIELIGNGRKIAWEVGHYIEELEQQMSSVLDAEINAATDGKQTAAKLVKSEMT